VNAFLLLLLAVFATAIVAVLAAVSLHRGRMPLAADLVIAGVCFLLAVLIMLLMTVPDTLPDLDTTVTPSPYGPPPHGWEHR
jgi:hypothetical protein